MVFMHPCCKNDTVPGNVTYLSHFLHSIEDISVILCCKNSDLVGKTVQKLAIKPRNAPPCEGQVGLPSTYIYRNTQKWFLEW